MARRINTCSRTTTAERTLRKKQRDKQTTKRNATSQDDSRRRRNPENEIRHRMMPQEPEDSNRFYVIEKLLDKRFNTHGNEEFLVRWQNYSPEWDSWEPRSELESNCRDMIEAFNNNKNKIEADEEERHCICRRPYRFEQGGLIQCFNCLSWLHFTCINMNMEEANSYSTYYCSFCRAMNPSFKNVLKAEKLNTFYGQRLSEDL